MARYIFGSFELDPVRLELRRDGIRLPLGARACRVLLALVERAGRVVSQTELLAAAWPGLHVEDVNLRVHIVALRKALAGAADGLADITTVPREGYVFTASVSAIDAGRAPAPSPAQAPRPLSPLIGRNEALERLGEALAGHRIVTIVGAAGIGKTALALAAATRTNGSDAECVFVDFSTSVSSLHVAGRLFEALRLEGTPNDIVAHIARSLSARTVLLVFDNCEHVIGGVAAIVAGLTSALEGVSILATSREPLRVPGERVFPLDALCCSPEGAVLTAESAVRYAAIELFVEAASLRSTTFAVDDANASLLGDICRRLDGIPLAIELAAALSDTLTIAEIARLLDDRFAVLTRGTRTALPRHRTLQAALDWSYDALSTDQARVMRRLGVFPGRFTAADAQAVAASGVFSDAAVYNALADLAAKSLVTVDVSGETASFRFLETMRVYARLKLLDSDEVSAVYARFVEHTLARLVEINGREEAALAERKGLYSDVLDDWRAAHDWATRTGDWHTALRLMEAGIGLCEPLNIKVEYVDRSVTTLRGVPADGPDEHALRLEMHVCDQQAQMLIDTQPAALVERVEAAALRVLELATLLNAPEQQMSALMTLVVGAQTSGNRAQLLEYTAGVDELARRAPHPDFLPVAHYHNGYAHYARGQFDAAVRDFDRALQGARPPKPGARIAFDLAPTVRVYRSRALWLRGDFEAGLEEVEEAHRSAVEGGHEPTLAYVAWGAGICVYLWAGALEKAAASARLFEDLAREHSNPGWAAHMPSVREATERLSHGRRSFDGAPVEWTPYGAFQADVMTSIHCAFHRPADLQRMVATPDHWCAAEHFRSAGEQQLAAGRPAEAEAHFLRALAIARGQRATAWEIRATLSLARLRVQQRQVATARAILEPLVERFTIASANADLVYANEMLASC